MANQFDPNCRSKASLLDEEMAKRCRDYVENYKEYGHEIPSMAGLSRHIGVSLSTLNHRWPDHSPEIFNPIKEALMAEQQLALLNGGLNKKFSSAVAMMILTKHGYSNKSEIDHTSSDRTMSPRDVDQSVVKALVDKLTD